jgi:uncharacterized protein YjbI with pentapeptide repeats
MDLLFWKKVSARKLSKILDAHQVWFSSRQKEGKRADLSDANLRGADLSSTNLSGANLEDATLMQDQLITAVIDEFTVLPDGSKG